MKTFHIQKVSKCKSEDECKFGPKKMLVHPQGRYWNFISKCNKSKSNLKIKNIKITKWHDLDETLLTKDQNRRKIHRKRTKIRIFSYIYFIILGWIFAFA